MGEINKTEASAGINKIIDLNLKRLLILVMYLISFQINILIQGRGFHLPEGANMKRYLTAIIFFFLFVAILQQLQIHSLHYSLQDVKAEIKALNESTEVTVKKIDLKGFCEEIKALNIKMDKMDKVYGDWVDFYDGYFIEKQNKYMRGFGK